MRAFILIAFIASPLMAADPVTWRSDYTSARKEASEANKAVCLVVGSDNCFYCKKLEGITMVDPAVTAVLARAYVGIKLDGSKEPELMKALKVTMFPTTVLASADGNIHAIINGFVSAEQMRDHLSSTLIAIAKDERDEKDFQLAKSTLESGDPVKSTTILRGIIADFKNRPIQIQAKELLEKADRLAATKAAMNAIRPQALLDVAIQLKNGNRLADSLDVAAEVIRSHPHSTEAKLALKLTEEIKTNPESLRTASRQADEKAAALQLALSESLLKGGDTVAAKAALDQVLKLCPTGPTADAANAHLTSLKGRVEFVPATLKK